jgi:hypothetical protein
MLTVRRRTLAGGKRALESQFLPPKSPFFKLEKERLKVELSCLKVKQWLHILAQSFLKVEK